MRAPGLYSTPVVAPRDRASIAVQSKVAARNEDYATIIRKLTFGRAPAAHCAADEADDGAGSPTAADAAPPVATLEDLSVHGSDAAEGSGHARRRRGETSSVVYRAAHAVVWLGDFNYRIDLERCVSGVCSAFLLADRAPLDRSVACTALLVIFSLL